MFVPRINPISGRTLNEEIAIARSIGGRLPFSVYLDLIWRGVIKEPIQKKKKASHISTAQEKNSE